MKTYLVSLTIQAGDYEKTSEMLISAENTYMAVDYAILMESHDPDSMEWDANGAADMGWEFFYKSRDCKLLPEEDVVCLKKYFPLHEASRDALVKSGNWLETQ